MYELKPIAKIHTPFPQKFGIPRQSGLTEAEAIIEFLPEYRDEKALRGLEGFSHIWLLWDFSEARNKNDFEPMVRPPRLGGEKQMGVFATRSPYRPNNIGLSSVELTGICKEDCDGYKGPLLYVKGADILDGTYIFDIKPYLKYSDAHNEATDGWTKEICEDELDVKVCPGVDLPDLVAENDLDEIKRLISQDPRSHKISPRDKCYKMAFKDFDIVFTVEDNTAKIIEISKI